MRRTRLWICCSAILTLSSGTLLSGQASSDPNLPDFDGPPPPRTPEVVARDAQGRVTVRAVRLETPLVVDGQLDESIYGIVPAMSDFIQVEPVGGAPATEKTEVWLTFDDDHVYVSFRCWEAEPERRVANEMRRDSFNLVAQNDNIAFIFDTFYDRRNSFAFEVNPIGGKYDAQVADGSRPNADWNTIWDVRTGEFEGGWTVETAIPFRSLRYRPGQAQLWGFNARRFTR